MANRAKHLLLAFYFIAYSAENHLILGGKGHLLNVRMFHSAYLSIGGWSAGGHSATAEGGESLSVCPHIPVSLSTHPSQSAHTSQSIYPHIPANQPTHLSQYAHTRQRILRGKATGAVPYTLLYIAFSGAFRRLLPRLLY